MWYTRQKEDGIGLIADVDFAFVDIAFEHGDLISVPENLTEGQVILQWEDGEGNWHDFG